MNPRNCWPTAIIDNLCETVSVGIVVKPSQYYVSEEPGIRAFRSGNVGESRIIDHDWVHISKDGADRNRKSTLEAGDVLVVRSGMPGTACVVTPQYAGANCIDILFARPRPAYVDSEYLAFFINSEVARKQVLNRQGGLAIKHFNVGDLRRLQIPVPPLPEQRKIAEILRTWDDAIEHLRNAIRMKFATAASIGRTAIAVTHASPADSRRLGDLFAERVETGWPDSVLLSVTQQHGVIRQDLAGRKNSSSADRSKYKLVKPGDIAYNTMRMWQGASGYVSEPGIVSPAYTVVVPDRSRIDPRYAAHLFKTERMKFDFERYSQGLTSDTWNLKYPAFSEIRISVPSLSEQRRVVEVLDSATRELSLLDRQIVLLRTQKRGLMQKLLTGEIRVTTDSTERRSR